jgi:hypothetical protein
VATRAGIAEAAAPVQARGKQFFSEEKNQKTFISALAALSGHGLPMGSCGGIKVFCFFFSKKKTLAGKQRVCDL